MLHLSYLPKPTSYHAPPTYVLQHPSSLLPITYLQPPTSYPMHELGQRAPCLIGRGPGGVKMDPHRPLGPFLEHLGLMDASWSGLGGLLERSWTALGPEKRSLERLLAAPRGIPRGVSAILRAKRLPKRSPGESKIGSKMRLELKT